MGTAGQVEGLAGALMRSVDEPDRIAMVQLRLDRYCHRLRNRLNSMKLSLYLARKLSEDGAGVDWGRTDEACRSIETLVEQLQLFCSPLVPAATEGDLTDWIDRRLPDWTSQLGDRDIRIESEAPDEPLPGTVDWTRLGQGLDGLIAAWSKFGLPGSNIRLGFGKTLGRCWIRFEGDDWILRPSGSVESLALPLLARVLSAHRGALSVRDAPASIDLSWPDS